MASQENNQVRHFLTLTDYRRAELEELLDISAALKKVYKSGGSDLCLAGKTMVMLFEKPSSRTRISFEVAMAQLGGTAIHTRKEDIGLLGEREPIADLTRVLNGYVDVIVARTFQHKSVEELARYGRVPVINALTDFAHPCQVMADMLTMRERFGQLDGLKLAYVGDGNNMARSLAVGCCKLGVSFSIATPAGYALDEAFLKELDGNIQGTVDPVEAVRGADVVYTDTWVSMGQEDEKEQRVGDFEGFQVNEQLLSYAKEGVKVMHCLPAYRGLEITDEVMESDRSIVFEQAENRLHFQRGLLKYLVG